MTHGGNLGARARTWVRRCASTTAVVAVTATAVVGIAPSASAKPVLSIGSTGKAVIKVQRKLGINPATGLYGPVTRKAVKKFQRSHGIPKTGVVARTTWRALRSASSTQSAPAPTSSSNVGFTKLRLGMTNESVRRLQAALGVSPTGYFGPTTLAYVRAFQQAAGLKVTGVVNRKTWNKIGTGSFAATTASSVPAGPTAIPILPKPPSVTAAKVLQVAASYAGVPYVADGYSPTQGFNCSSYTQWVFGQIGIDLGGAYTVTQYNKFPHISRAQALPGDLVFMYNYKDDFIGHVGIYAGNNMFWHAPRPGRVVSLDPIYTDKVLFARVL